jgi:hypothetical protein
MYEDWIALLDTFCPMDKTLEDRLSLEDLPIKANM